MIKRVLITAATAATLACAGAEQDPQKVSLTFQAQLDSGNAAYRRGDYKASASFFHKATQTDSANLSGWYGVYMAESKLGNEEAAAAAKAVVASKAPEMPLTEHPKAADHPGGALTAPVNPHVPQGDDPHAKVPIDSVRAAKGKT
jgi:hypothetical protein